MEIILQSQDNFNEIASLDLDSGIVTITSKPEREVRTNGYYSFHDDNVICFFRIDEDLYFTLDRQTIKFQESDKVFIESLPNSRCLLSIQRGQEVIFTWEYKSLQMSPSVSASQIVNPMISEEDFDIFLFIHNVMNDVNRKKRVFRRFQ